MSEVYDEPSIYGDIDNEGNSIYADLDDDIETEEDVCANCLMKDGCDMWEAQFCCTLCHSYSNFDESWCDNCDPWDI